MRFILELVSYSVLGNLLKSIEKTFLMKKGFQWPRMDFSSVGCSHCGILLASGLSDGVDLISTKLEVKRQEDNKVLNIYSR